MKPRTVSETYTKAIPVLCKRDDRLEDLDIQNNCFWMAMLYEGSVRLEVGNRIVEAIAPCFICFDERTSPRLIRKRGIRCDSIYFDPTFINLNMTFSLVHNEKYEDVASLHDLFLLRPFTDDRAFVFPLFSEYIDNARRMFAGMRQELIKQADWYWSCRSRSYFIELMFILERAYGYIGQSEMPEPIETIQNDHLQKAVLYIESHYSGNITLAGIAEAAMTNHTTLTHLFKDELNMTPMEYVWHHRINVAKKQLEFTSLPIKDIAARCGFKTVQHFSRKFEMTTGSTPTGFRSLMLQRRRDRLMSDELVCGQPSDDAWWVSNDSSTGEKESGS